MLKNKSKSDTKFVLGPLCKRNHIHKGSKPFRSLRYETSNTCVQCQCHHNQIAAEGANQFESRTKEYRQGAKAKIRSEQESTSFKQHGKEMVSCLCCEKSFMGSKSNRVCKSCHGLNERISHSDYSKSYIY